MLDHKMLQRGMYGLNILTDGDEPHTLEELLELEDRETELFEKRKRIVFGKDGQAWLEEAPPEVLLPPKPASPSLESKGVTVGEQDRKRRLISVSTLSLCLWQCDLGEQAQESSSAGVGEEVKVDVNYKLSPSFVHYIEGRWEQVNDIQGQDKEEDLTSVRAPSLLLCSAFWEDRSKGIAVGEQFRQMNRTSVRAISLLYGLIFMGSGKMG